MKIAVIGSGIVGVTSAYELATDGHEVTVFEQRGSAAEEASFANAGVVAPGYVTPWAAPGMPAKVLQHLLSRHAPVRLRLPLSAAELTWMWKWWRACKPTTYHTNRQHLQRLAFYSRERLHQLHQDLKFDYERGDGYTVLLRSEKDHTLMQSSLQVLRDAGIAFQELDPSATRLIEPALNPDAAFHSAIHLADDEVGNCRQFALLLKTEAQRLGVRFRFNTTVAPMDASFPARLSIATNANKAISAQDTEPTTLEGSSAHAVQRPACHSFDAVLVCAGVHSAALLRPLGLKLPLAAVYGYSISANIREPLNAPRSAVMDEHYKIAMTRLGQRVRVAGSAEIGGSAEAQSEKAIQTLYKVLHDWFPGAAQLSGNVQTWKGARPMLPDGPPLIGTSGIPGVWLNLGHGSSGWALSCGSARAVADAIQGREPEVNLEGFGISRLGLRSSPAPQTASW
jgi:D-amino-acid dehydrogenase